VADEVQESAGQAKVVTDTAVGFPSKVRTFVADVVTEIRKTSWPSRQELVESTWVVIIMVLALGMYIAVCDRLLLKVLELLVPRG
jgi:preprotein translocase subunit SecE